MLQQQSVGFQPVNHVPLPPHIESARNLLFGKPKSDRLSCREYQYRSQTQLEMARRAPVIDMDKEYQNFLLMKHPETECSQERFKALSTDPQRKMIDEYSIKETIIILEAEGRGIVKGAERPDLDNGEPNIDFKVKGPGNHRYVDVKEPRNFGRGNQDLDSAARRMGHKIYKQIKNQFIKPQFKIIQKDGSDKKINKLQTQQITQIKVIYFYENVDYKSLFKQK